MIYQVFINKDYSLPTLAMDAFEDARRRMIRRVGPYYDVTPVELTENEWHYIGTINVTLRSEYA